MNNAITITLPHAASKPQVLAAFVEALSLPAYFGYNWDALDDALNEYLTHHPHTTINITGTAATAVAAVLEDVLFDAQQTHPDFTYAMVQT